METGEAHWENGGILLRRGLSTPTGSEKILEAKGGSSPQRKCPGTTLEGPWRSHIA